MHRKTTFVSLRLHVLFSVRSCSHSFRPAHQSTVSLCHLLKQATRPNRPICKKAITNVPFFIQPTIREIMGIISLMSSKLKMESRFPRESRLLYKGHSLHTAAMSNSPTAEMLFAPNGNMGSFFCCCCCCCSLCNTQRRIPTGRIYCEHISFMNNKYF